MGQFNPAPNNATLPRRGRLNKLDSPADPFLSPAASAPRHAARFSAASSAHVSCTPLVNERPHTRESGDGVPESKTRRAWRRLTMVKRGRGRGQALPVALLGVRAYESPRYLEGARRDG